MERRSVGPSRSKLLLNPASADRISGRTVRAYSLTATTVSYLCARFI